MVPEIRCATDRIFCHFGPFFALLPLYQPEKLKFWKNENKIPGDIITLHKSTENHDHTLHFSWNTMHDRCNFWFSFWASFCPFTLPLNNTKNLNFTKMKKIPGDFIILHLYNKNHDHMMYSFWDMVHNGWKDGQTDRKVLSILYV